MSDNPEKSAIIAAIEKHGGNITKAARELGASRRTLQRHMRANGIPTGTAGRRKRLLPYAWHKRSKSNALLVGAAAAAGAVALFVGKRGSRA